MNKDLKRLEQKIDAIGNALREYMLQNNPHGTKYPVAVLQLAFDEIELEE